MIFNIEKELALEDYRRFREDKKLEDLRNCISDVKVGDKVMMINVRDKGIHVQEGDITFKEDSHIKIDCWHGAWDYGKYDYIFRNNFNGKISGNHVYCFDKYCALGYSFPSDIELYLVRKIE